MKTQRTKIKLIFNKKNIVELNDNKLSKINSALSISISVQSSLINISQTTLFTSFTKG